MYENGFKKEDVSVEWDGFDVMKETDIIVRAGDSLLLTVKVEGATYYPLTDIQGTVWGYVDSQNDIVAQWRYDAWGNAIGGNVSVPALVRLRYRFQGREWSAATGLVNFRMRWYDSETGRWLSKDPIRLGGGLNLYAFCGSDPLNGYDPFGMSQDKSSILEKAKEKLKAAWEALKTAAGPMCAGETAGALDAVPNGLTVLGQNKEIKNAQEELSQSPEDLDYKKIEEIENRFRKWSNGSGNIFNML